MPPAARPIARDHELDLVDELLDAAARGSGRLLVLEGPSGVGKTVLLQEARRRALRHGIQVHGTTGSELETDYPFSALLKSFAPWHAKLDSDQRVALSQGLAGSAMSLLEDSRSDGDDYSIILGLYWLTVRLSEQTPLLLLIDDAQWIDEPSLRFVNYLASSLEDLPILVVVAVRHGDPRAADPLIAGLATLATSRTIVPAAFSEPDVAELLRREAPPLAAVPGAADRLHAVTGGNPFLLRELIAGVRAGEIEDLAAWLDDLDSFAPLSVQRHIVQRITRLGPESLAVVRAFAVLGKSATLGLAGHVSGLDLDDAAAAADRLTRADILQDTNHPAFSHPTVRAAVLADMTPGQVAATHTRIALRMHALGEPAETLAHHLVAGIGVHEPWAAAAVRSAAARAVRNGLPSTAVRYLEHAVGLVPPGEARVHLEVDLALSEVACGAIASAVERLEDAVLHLSEPRDQAHCLSALGQALVRHARYTEATAVLERCRILATTEDPEMAREVEGLILIVAYFLHDAPISVRRADADTMRSIAAQSHRTAAERGLLAISALHSVLGAPPVSRGARLAALALAGPADGPTTAIQLDYVAILALIYADEFDLAAQSIGIHRERALGTGSVPAVAEACLLQCTLDLTRGRIAQAEVNATIAINAMHQGWSALTPMAQGLMLMCLVQRGDLDRAQSLADEITAATVPAAGALRVWTHAGLGQLHLARGRSDQAAEAFLAAGRLLQRHEAISPAVLRWRSQAGLAALASGNRTIAESLIDEERSLAADFGMPRIEAMALCASASLSEPGRRHDVLEQARLLLEDCGNDLDLAECLGLLGVELTTLDRLPEARDTLRRALDLAHSHGAGYLEGRLRDDLRAAGARVRQVAQHGVPALTPTERRIADLAAGGATNSEIGQEVFLARSTVAWYMRRILRKLGIESRVELEARLAEDQPAETDW